MSRVPNGVCVCAGGASLVNDLARFDTLAGLWSPVEAPSPPAPRAGLGLAELGRTLYVFGGLVATGACAARSAAQ